jgi:dipeptidyl aminopeptidase/acylaminoacyl peptidase
MSKSLLSPAITSAWRPVCAAALLIGLLHGGWSPAAHAASMAAEASLSAPVPVSAKKIITHDVYANWRSIQGSVLSRDGNWAAYALVAQEADGEVVFRNLQDGREWRAARGAAPVFSADGKYAAFAIRPTRAEIEKAKKDKKKGDDLPKSGLGIIDLSTGKIENIDRVRQYAWPEEGASLLKVLMEPVEEKKAAKKETEPAAAKTEDEEDQAARNASASGKKKDAGTELILIDAVSRQRHSWKDVVDATWAKNGSLLAFSVKVKTPPKEGASGEGVFVYNTVNQQTSTVLGGSGNYKSLRFDEAGKQLAFLSNHEEARKKIKEETPSAKKATESEPDGVADKDDTSVYQLFYWKAGDTEAKRIAGADTAGMPAGWGVSAYGEIGFSKDGQRLFLGTAALPKPQPKDAPEPVKVDLWHWQDPELQSMQKVNAEKDKHRNFKAVIHLDAQRFVQLATPQMPHVAVNDNPRFAMGTSDVPYKMLISWDGSYRDVYAVDLQTGQARLLTKKLRFSPSMSPAGKYIMAFDAATSQWLAWSSADGNKINLTAKVKTRFDDFEHDTPEPRSAYGSAGWTENDQSVVLYDQFDLWEINPQTLAAKNLTAGIGRKNQLQFRYINLEANEPADPTEEPTPVAESKTLPQTALLLSATNLQNRATGFYQLPLNGGEPRKLIYGDKLFGGVIKAKNADAILYTEQSFVEFPDLWASDLNLQQAKKISTANPQQAQYNWGTQEMIEYTTTDGKKLKALLAKPENFDPSKKYPMMVYIYEKMTDNLHRHVPPAPSQNINVTRYLSNGYIVLRPDIVYETGHPGKSAMRAVPAAVQKVIGMGFVDPKRVGIQGHSWGAYQINYMITQTNMFRAAEAGAAMADMVSGYGGIRWGKGVSRAFQYETGQSRIGGTPWNKTAEYIENSPIFYIDKVQTPYLTKHNDDDDAVPWYQAIEFFTAMRRLGKEAYWFNYNGEKHGLKDRENVKHYTVHMAEFFDHFLLGKPRPEWMEKPIPYLERGKRDVTPLFKPAEVKTGTADATSATNTTNTITAK